MLVVTASVVVVVVVVGVDVVVVFVVGFSVVVVFSNVVSTLDESNSGIVEVSINTPVVSVVSTGSLSVGFLDSMDALLVLCSLPKPVVFNSTVVDLEPKRSPTGVVDSSTTTISTKMHHTNHHTGQRARICNSCMGEQFQNQRLVHCTL